MKTTTTAIKSGKEFEVLEIMGENVTLKDVLTGEVKDIKESTFKKNYTPAVEVAETIPAEVVVEEITQAEEVPSDMLSEEQVLANAVRRLSASIQSNGEESAFEDTVMECLVNLDAVDLGEITTVQEALRIRDNNRQCYKENESRFRATLASITYCADDAKFLPAYAKKMGVYYSKYMVAKEKATELKSVSANAGTQN